MERIVNRNPSLYGPGPVARRMGGLGSRKPLHSLVAIASQGIVLSISLAFAWKYTFGVKEIKVFEDYYQRKDA
jgi:hypothetical protein